MVEPIDPFERRDLEEIGRGGTPSEIARRCGVSFSTVVSVASEHASTLERAEVNRVDNEAIAVDLAEMTLSMAEIARRHECSRANVRRVAAARRIERPAQQPQRRITGVSALQFWGLSDMNPRKIRLLVPPGYTPRKKGGEAYQLIHGTLPSEHEDVVDHVPTVTPDEAIRSAAIGGTDGDMINQAIDKLTNAY